MPVCRELSVLFVVRRCYHQATEPLPKVLALDATTVMTVAHQYPGVCIGKSLFDLVVVLVGRREYQGGQSVLVVNGRM